MLVAWLEGCFRDDFDRPPKDLLELIAEMHEVEQRTPRLEPDEDVDVTGVGVLAARGRSEHGEGQSVVPLNRGLNLVTMLTDKVEESPGCHDPIVGNAAAGRCPPRFAGIPANRAGDRVLPLREVADRVLELYWPAARPYPGVQGVLRQANMPNSRIASAIGMLRAAVGPGQWSLGQARLSHPGAVDEAVGRIAKALATQPVPRLQRPGETSGGVESPDFCSTTRAAGRSRAPRTRIPSSSSARDRHGYGPQRRPDPDGRAGSVG